MRLKDKVALLIGCSPNIGRSIKVKNSMQLFTQVVYGILIY